MLLLTHYPVGQQAEEKVLIRVVIALMVYGAQFEVRFQLPVSRGGKVHAAKVLAVKFGQIYTGRGCAEMFAFQHSLRLCSLRASPR